MEKSTSRKQRIAIICSGVVLLAITVTALIVVLAASLYKPTDGAALTKYGEYLEDSEFSSLVSVGSQDVLDMLEDGEAAFLYVGRQTCPNCVMFSPILLKVVEERGYLVYYYDADRANDNMGLKSQAFNAIGVTGVPSFLYIKDGVVVDRLSDRSSEEPLIEFIEAHL